MGRTTDKPLTDAQRSELARLLDQRWSSLRGWAFVLAGRYGLEGEEVLAQSLLRIARVFPVFDPRRSAFITWAGAVMEYEASVMRRSTFWRWGRLASPLPRHAGVSANLDARLELLVVLGVVGRLTAEQRISLGLAMVGYENIEVASRLGMSRQAVQWRLKNAREKLEVRLV